MLSPDPSRRLRAQQDRHEHLAVRRAGADDSAFVLSLAYQAFAVYGSYDSYMEDWLRDDAVRTHVAELDGRRAGFFMVTSYEDDEHPGRHVADLVAIAVAPELQSRGIGKRLLDDAVRVARSLEPTVSEMWLVVAEGNSRAQRFFARHGFRRGRGVGVYPAGQRALRMFRPIGEGL